MDLKSPASVAISSNQIASQIGGSCLLLHHLQRCNAPPATLQPQPGSPSTTRQLNWRVPCMLKSPVTLARPVPRVKALPNSPMASAIFMHFTLRTAPCRNKFQNNTISEISFEKKPMLGNLPKPKTVFYIFIIFLDLLHDHELILCLSLTFIKIHLKMSFILKSVENLFFKIKLKIFIKKIIR